MNDEKKGFQEDPAKTNTAPGEQEIQTLEAGGKIAMWKKIVGTILAVVLVVVVALGFNSWKDGSKAPMQPQITQADIDRAVNAQVAPVLAQFAARAEGGVADPQDSMKASTREQVMQGAAEGAKFLQLNFHQAALEEKGLDPETAAYHTNGMHLAATVDPEFYKPIKKSTKGLLDSFRNGTNTAGRNAEDIVGLKATDELLETNTLANTAANIRRDPNSKEIAKYIPLPRLAEYGYQFGLTDKMNAASYDNEMAAREKTDKNLRGGIWRNKKALNGFFGEGLNWKKKVDGTASTRLAKITLTTE